jgi:hypothetical protein
MGPVAITCVRLTDIESRFLKMPAIAVCVKLCNIKGARLWRTRPRGARNKRPALNEERLKGIILDEACRTITINEGEKRISIPIAQAVVRAMAVNAARGQHRAQRLFAELLTTTETANNTLYREYFGKALDYRKYWQGEIARCKALGLEVPNPIPRSGTSASIWQQAPS